MTSIEPAGKLEEIRREKGNFFSFPNRSRIVGIDSCHSLPVSEFANSEAGVISQGCRRFLTINDPR